MLSLSTTRPQTRLRTKHSISSEHLHLETRRLAEVCEVLEELAQRNLVGILLFEQTVASLRVETLVAELRVKQRHRMLSLVRQTASFKTITPNQKATGVNDDRVACPRRQQDKTAEEVLGRNICLLKQRLKHGYTRVSLIVRAPWLLVRYNRAALSDLRTH